MRGSFHVFLGLKELRQILHFSRKASSGNSSMSPEMSLFHTAPSRGHYKGRWGPLPWEWRFGWSFSPFNGKKEMNSRRVIMRKIFIARKCLRQICQFQEQTYCSLHTYLHHTSWWGELMSRHPPPLDDFVRPILCSSRELFGKNHKTKTGKQLYTFGFQSCVGRIIWFKRLQISLLSTAWEDAIPQL